MTRCVTHKSLVPTPKVKVPRLCSRSQPGIKVIIRDLRGHLLHTETFLVVLNIFKAIYTLYVLVWVVRLLIIQTSIHPGPGCSKLMTLSVNRH